MRNVLLFYTVRQKPLVVANVANTAEIIHMSNPHWYTYQVQVRVPHSLYAIVFDTAASFSVHIFHTTAHMKDYIQA